MTKISYCISVLLTGLSAQAFADDNVLEEVMVTAQKRVQNAQQVPVSITAFSQQQIRELGATDIFDLQSSAPSLQVSNTQSASTTFFSIRGVGTSSQNAGLESSVGLYVDGVYRSRQSSVTNELIDVAAIEVLRGPQGTLFGRNTPSGAIQIKTVAPSQEQSGFLNVTAGNYGLLSTSAAIGGALLSSNKWSYRATLFSSERDGFVSDANFGDDLINDRDRQGARFQLMYQPNEDFSARIIADYSQIDEVCCAPTTVLNNFSSANNQAGSDALLTALGGNIISEDRRFENVTALNSLPISENNDTGLSLEMNLGNNQDGQWTSITAIRQFEQSSDIDIDFTDVDLFNRSNFADTQSFSQELRFTKNTRLADFVVGAYYFEQTIDSGVQINPGSSFPTFITQDPQLSQLVAGAQAFGLPVADIFPAGSSSQDAFTQEHSSAAVFGQVDFYPTERITVSAGLRYTDEQKEVQGHFTQGNTGPQVDLNAIASGDLSTITNLTFAGWGYTLGGPLTVVSERDDVDAELDDSQVTGTLKLAYNPSRNTLVYASYSTGYKSGGTNTDRIDPRFNTLFGAETSRSFEVGMKKDFPLQGLRINLSLHDTVTEDFQTVAFDGTGFNLTNAGEANTRGAELEMLWYPTDTLSFTGAVVINDGEFSSFPGASCWTVSPFQTGQNDPTNVNGICDRSGADLSFNPEEVFMFSVNKQFKIASHNSYLRADYFYRSSAFEDGDLDPLKEQDAYGLLNLKTGIFLNNGKTELSLWARNVLDEEYLGTHFTAPLQTGKLNAYVQEPKTFGVSIRHDF